MSKNYDFVGKVELWTDDDLVQTLKDMEVCLSLEKRELAALAQELALRHELCIELAEDDFGEEEEDEEDIFRGGYEYN